MIITEITQTCGACPASWEAKTVDGKSLYIRYRYGHLTVRDNTDNVCIYSMTVGDDLDGVMSYDDLQLHLADFAVFVPETAAYRE